MNLCNVPPGLQNLIRSVAYLVRGAIFRPQEGGDWVSNAVCSLGELMDMYHTHEATIPSDKVYALLGMSSDDFYNTGLAPDYSIPWKDLFEILTRHVLCKELSVEALPEEKYATIRGKGYILGSISTLAETTMNGRQDVLVAWRRRLGTAMTAENWNSRWDIQPSAKQIMKGDVVCLFQGASKPTIIRFCEDHWTIVVIAATPPRPKRAKGEELEWSKYLQDADGLRVRELRCSWNLDKSPRKMSDQEEHNAARGSLDHIIETWNSALVLGDAEEYRKAESKFQEAMENYEMTFRGGRVNECSAGLLWFTSSADLDFMNERYDRSPLIWAAERGYEAVVSLLVGILNGKANFHDKVGQTMLQAAAGGGQLAVVERLLQEKSDVNTAAAEHAGRTALQAAAGGGHLEVVERLLQEKAEVNAAAAIRDGRTALQAAAGGGYLTVVERLLQEKADVNAAAAMFDGRTAIQAAAGGGYLTVVERLLQEKADVNAAAAYENGRTALQAAAGGGHLAVVERLLQEKADVNAAAARVSGRTALQAAADGGHLAVVEQLQLFEVQARIRTKICKNN
jgi:ankyrin repeat protein